jgi:16S rRNA (cytidine1402-2'-O)-methyltransferase
MIELAVESLKRQKLPDAGRLYMIATPLGNLEDLSPRARSVLSELDLLLAEDTRRARTLVSALGLKTPPRIERLDAHAERGDLEPILDVIEAGACAALVTDAGTPGVSDPGSKLVAAAHARGIRVEPIPGPSALTAFLSVAGFSGAAFVFRGFFPRKKGDRERELRAWLEASPFCGSAVWFESPERVLSTFEDLLAVLPPAQEICAAKELTKTFERVWRGKASELLPELISELTTDPALQRGEWVFGLEENQGIPADLSEKGDWRTEARERASQGEKAAHIARDLSQRFGVDRAEVYAEATRTRESRRK